MTITTNTMGHVAELTAIAAKLNLPMMETDKLMNSVVPDILRSIYRYPLRKSEKGKMVDIPLTKEEKEINADVERAYKELTGQPYPSFRGKVRPRALFGPPGHGKTSSLEAASKIAADALGWRYVSAEDLEFVPLEEIDHKTFVFMAYETAGATSAQDLMGLPNAETIAGESKRYLDRIFSMPFHKITRAGGGTFLLDDVLNAARHIQDAVLPILDRRRIGQLNLRSSYICLTGNLGALDDSNATRAASPMRGRVRSALAYDTVENFIARTRANPEFRDELGDAFVRAFFQRFPQYFSGHPVRGQQGGFEAPRSWDSFIHAGREILHRHGGRENARAARDELYDAAAELVGPSAASDFNAFLESVLNNADPLARQIITTGELDEKELKKIYSGGHSSREQNFAYQFAIALVDYGTQKIITDDKLEDAVHNFGKALSYVSEDVFAFALEEFKAKVSVQVESVNKGKRPVSRGKGSSRKLISEVATQIGEMLMKTGTIDKTRRSTMISILSEANQHAQRASIGPSASTRSRRD